MGTRSRIVVIDEQKNKKIDFYCQWDGYFSYMGIKLLERLRDKELIERFKTNLDKCYFSDGSEEISEDYYDKFISRDVMYRIIENVADCKLDKIVLQELTDKEAEKWLEYCYVIDFSNNVFMCYHSACYIDENPEIVCFLNELPTNEDFLKSLEE